MAITLTFHLSGQLRSRSNSCAKLSEGVARMSSSPLMYALRSAYLPGAAASRGGWVVLERRVEAARRALQHHQRRAHLGGVRAREAGARLPVGGGDDEQLLLRAKLRFAGRRGSEPRPGRLDLAQLEERVRREVLRVRPEGSPVAQTRRATLVMAVGVQVQVVRTPVTGDSMSGSCNPCTFFSSLSKRTISELTFVLSCPVLSAPASCGVRCAAAVGGERGRARAGKRQASASVGLAAPCCAP